MGKVFLVGAGPGGVGLMTLKARACLQEAQVIVLDRLVNAQALLWANPTAELVYAGKSPHGHALTQEEINRLLVEEAQAGKTVVRLKGGDPLVLGRGGEEAEALAAAGIAFEIVPGVTSAVAVPAYAGIPVTHRNWASAVTIVTGNEDPSKASDLHWEALARGSRTLVFLMGVHNLVAITERLKQAGMSPEVAAALIQWGTRCEEKMALGTLANIAEKAEAMGIANPAVLVVGEVVRLAPALNWRHRLPLRGYRLMVTRPLHQAWSLARRLALLGAEPWIFPAVEIDPLPAADRLWEQLTGEDWLVFTSANGVEVFLGRCRTAHGQDIRRLAGIRLAAIGPATAAKLRDYGLNVDLVAPEYRSEALAQALITAGVRGKKVFLARAQEGRPVLAENLRAAGARVEEVPLYRVAAPALTPIRQELARQTRQLLQEKRVHAITFTSPSAWNYLPAALGLDGPASLVELLEHGQVAVGAIGPITASALKAAGLKVDFQAQVYTEEGLVSALLQFLQQPS